MNRKWIFILALCVSSILASAQDYKPFKDKSSKKYGYKYKSKDAAWVIEPMFDKASKFENGAAVVTVGKLDGVIAPDGSYIFEPQFADVPSFDRDGISVASVKENRQRLYTVINTAGEVILPPDCISVRKDRSRGVLLADRLFTVENPGRFLVPVADAWGVYDYMGREIFAPRFESHPSFYSDGTAIVRDKSTLMCGVIGADGCTIVPFDFYYVDRNGSAYKALDRRMQLVDISADGRNAVLDRSVPPMNWIPEPYDPAGDVVKAFAYKHNMLGVKVYRNAFWEAQLQLDPSRNAARMMTMRACDPSGSPIDWGRFHDCFVRMELEADPQRGSFVADATGLRYTVQLKLFDPAGRLVRVLSRWGSIVSESAEGVFYQAEGVKTYFLSRDLNWIDEPVAVPLMAYRSIDASSMADELGLDIDCLNRMSDYWSCKHVFYDVDRCEKSGYQSYIPFGGPLEGSPEAKLAGLLEFRNMFLRKKYYMENTYSIMGMDRKDGTARIEVAPGYVAHYHDDYGNGFTMDLEEPVFWGARQDRYIRIMLDPFVIKPEQKSDPGSVHGMVNDLDDRALAVRFVLGLFEEDGSFVRIIGSSDRISIVGDDVFGFEDLGLLFSHRRPVGVEIKTRLHDFKGDKLSSLGSVNF